MKHLLTQIDYYFITDSGLSKQGSVEDVKFTVKAGCKIVQYREKNKSASEMISEAALIQEICRNKAILLINDRVDIALAVNADGIHLGQDDMPISIARKLLGKNKIIGVSVDNVSEAIDAEKAGADYIGLGPIYATTTKKDAGKVCGTDMIRKVKSVISVPLVAVGGITKHNVSETITAGADSAVAISAVVGKENISDETQHIITIIKNAKRY